MSRKKLEMLYERARILSGVASKVYIAWRNHKPPDIYVISERNFRSQFQPNLEFRSTPEFDFTYFKWVPHTASGRANTGRERFSKLVIEWKKRTLCASAVEDIVYCEPYQQIIGMGEQAVPLILMELAKELDHWFWALKSITQTQPPISEKGNLEALRQAWLKWGRESGYLFSEENELPRIVSAARDKSGVRTVEPED